MTDRTSVVADFWLAVARNHEEAQNTVRHLNVPIISISLAYSFEMVEGEEHLAEVVEQEDTGALVGPVRGVMPDTPTSTVDAWNAEVGVSLNFLWLGHS